MKEGECIMGGISDLVGALALLGITQAWDALEEERKSRQEVFVPFKLPPLLQQAQTIGQLTTADRSPVAVARGVSHARSTP
jgi:hypothetical protein